MIKEKVFTGAPFNFYDICNIYPLLIKDIIEDEDILNCIELLIQSQEDIDDWYEEYNVKEEHLTPFIFLLRNCSNSKLIEEKIIKAFKKITHKDIVFLYNANIILIGISENELKNITNVNDLKYINENNFFEFQNAIRLSIGREVLDLPDPEENYLTKQIKAKNRKRERIVNKNKKGVSFSASLAAICCMGFGINPLNIGELSYASFKELIKIYQRKEMYELDINSLLAGADSKKIKPKYWISEQSNLIDIQI